MCGLLYARSLKINKPINKFVIKQYINQRSRGTEGFGVYDGQFKHIIRSTKETKIRKWLIKHPSQELLFHHRRPTSTDNVKSAAHPFSTKDHFSKAEYILIHNGMIHNSRELKEKHEGLGIEYQSVQPDGRFNDSEALMWEFALFMEGWIEKMEAYGSVAFICIEKQLGKNSRLHYYRNTSNPLWTISTKRHFALASEKRKEQAGHEVVPDKLFSYNYQSDTTNATSLVIPTFKSSVMTDDERWNQQLQQTIAGESHIDEDESSYMNLIREEQLEMFSNIEVLKEDYIKVVKRYLKKAEGKYEIAVGLIREKIVELDEEQYDINNWYRQEIYRGAMAILIADPFWKGTESTHPDYLDKNAGGVIEKPSTPPLLVSVPVHVRVKPTDNQIKTSFPLPKNPIEHVHNVHNNKTVHIGEILDKHDATQYKVEKQIAEHIGEHHSVGDTPALVTSIPTNEELAREVLTA